MNRHLSSIMRSPSLTGLLQYEPGFIPMTCCISCKPLRKSHQKLLSNCPGRYEVRMLKELILVACQAEGLDFLKQRTSLASNGNSLQQICDHVSSKVKVSIIHFTRPYYLDPTILKFKDQNLPELAGPNLFDYAKRFLEGGT